MILLIYIYDIIYEKIKRKKKKKLYKGYSHLTYYTVEFEAQGIPKEGETDYLWADVTFQEAESPYLHFRVNRIIFNFSKNYESYSLLIETPPVFANTSLIMLKFIFSTALGTYNIRNSKLYYGKIPYEGFYSEPKIESVIIPNSSYPMSLRSDYRLFVRDTELALHKGLRNYIKGMFPYIYIYY